jgi:multidrug efflux pump subunit AcrA (membrane-fusion protein)
MLLLLMDVRQEDVDKLALGQKVTFHSTASTQTATGTLGWISPEVDLKTRTVKARADVYNPTGRLRPATYGKVEIQIASPSGVSVPVGAVQWDGKSHRVFVQRDRKTFEPRLVLPGPRRDNRVELLDPRMLMAGGLPGQFAGAGGVFGSLGMAAAANEVFVPVLAGERVATTGSQALKSEMLKARIGGGD